MAIQITPSGSDVLIPVKVVPKSSRDRIAGELDGALKINVSAPPERGAANDAVCRLIARTLGIRARQVRVESGHASPRKVIRVCNVTLETVSATLSS